MKNVLFISDTFSGGGLETRITEQIKIFKKRNVKAFLLCRELNELYSKEFITASNTLALEPFSENTSVQEILNNVDIICNFCLRNNIDFIDCHPSWCSLPAALAAARLNVPISFTLHGKISADFIKNEYLTAQSLYNIIFSYGFTQIFAVAEYLTELYSYLPNIEIIRNGVLTNQLKTPSFKNTKKIALASRLDETKTNLIIDFLPSLYKTKAIMQIDIYGDGNYAKPLQSFIDAHHMDSKVNLCGWTKDFAKTIEENQYMLVFGMGRVVLEALRVGIPVGVLGYGGFAGLVNHDNLINFSKDNFTSWQKASTTIQSELKKLFKNPNDYIFRPSQLSAFDTNHIWQKYFNIVSNLSYKDNSVIQSLYNWLLSHPSANLLNNQELFLNNIRLLSDGNRPINQKLFYNIFQHQFDQINSLSSDLKLLKTQLSEKTPTSPSKTFKRHLKNFIKKHK